MKRIKKIFAFALAMVMMLAMNVTVFAENEGATTETSTTKITVNNLSTREDTTVAIYKVAELDENGNSWVIADWAASAVTLGADGAEAEVDWEALEAAVRGENSTVEADDTIVAEKEATVEFTDVKTGLYLVLATGSKVTYSPMGAVTYDLAETNPYIVAADATVVAKSSTSILEKEASDSFVAANEDINFTITTMIPYGKDEFVVYDVMTNLILDEESVKVTIGGVETTLTMVEDSNVPGKYTVDFTSVMADNIGKTVVITYTAKVDGVNGYVNTAWDNINGEDSKVNVPGYTGDITLTKLDTDEETVLSGAQFQVFKNNDAVALYFVKTADGVYSLATSDTTNATQTVEATNGTVKVMGLDEGTYSFHETLAPVGYSINETPTEVTISDLNEDGASVTANVSESGEMIDSKLSALPSTGGIGTTIFTIAGVAIMVLAAGLFFVSRRKNAR
ncbi:MAG: SpaH/EbpB family LPXTG-anchored major pilin [Lachnospiraceae bacterium]